MTAEQIKEIFGAACLACATLGVLEAFSAANISRLGEAPDQGGRAGLGGGEDDSAAVIYYIALRSHYRRSGSEVGAFSNCLLLVSVVAGLGINFVGIAWFEGGMTALSCLALGVALWILYDHKVASQRRLLDLNNQRLSFARRFPNLRQLLDLREYETIVSRR